MTDPSDRSFSDEELLALAGEIEEHDFERIAPPGLVWNNILASFEEEVAKEEAAARRAPSPQNAPGRFSPARLLSAAAVTLLMVGVAVAVVTLDSDDTTVTPLAAASMTDIGLQVPTTATADATFACDDSRCFLELDLTSLPESGADDLELWVINGDVTDMHSLGTLTSESARYEIPFGVTADEFPIVDISVEPADGDPTHSGQSVLRGVFEDI